MPKLPAHIPAAAVLAVAGLAAWAPAAVAHQPPDRGGVLGAEGRYGVVLSLDEARPNPRITPGAVNPAVNQSNIGETICSRGYAKSIRPPADYTERLKLLGLRQYGYSDQRLRDYEEDHLISLALGGSPTAPQNLWPEPRHVIGGWGSDAKDRLEDELHTLVCRRRLPLAQAQNEIASDWIAAYKRYIGPNPSPARRHRRRRRAD